MEIIFSALNLITVHFVPLYILFSFLLSSFFISLRHATEMQNLCCVFSVIFNISSKKTLKVLTKNGIILSNFYMEWY